MSSSPEYWIWLQKTLGAGASSEEILNYFGGPEKLYASGRKAWQESGLFNDSIIRKLISTSPSETYPIIKSCRDNGWHIVTFDDEHYPAALKQITNFPLVLYVQGDVSILDSAVLIGMVGTRKATGYGKDIATGLAYDLANAGVVVVSGGALGIDSCAHEGAMKAGKKTIAFLGNGLGYDYLKANENLRNRIAENGAVVSEMLPFESPSRRTFPVRNRLISGISQGTVVIEAGEKSGSLITARYAMEQGRDVFAVPGNIFSNGYTGTNELIREGAKAVFSVSDILAGYLDKYSEYLDAENLHNSLKPNNNYSGWGSAEKTEKVIQQKEKNVPEPAEIKPEPEKQKAVMPEYATENAVKLFGFIGDEPKTADELVVASGMLIHEVLAALTELEMYALVSIHSGKRYAKN